MLKLPRRTKREKPRDARDKFVQQLQLRAIDECKQTQQELMQVRSSKMPRTRCDVTCVSVGSARLAVDAADRESAPERSKARVRVSTVYPCVTPAPLTSASRTKARATCFTAACCAESGSRRCTRFAPWFLKSNQIQLNRWSSVLFARLEQAFYARPEELKTLEKIMREHQAQYDAIMKAPASEADEAKTQKMDPREQNHKMLVRAFRDCSFRPPQEDSKKSASKAKEATMATIQAESDAFVERLEVVPEVAVRPGPPGLALQVRGQLESRGRHTFFHYNGRWKDGEMHGPMGVYTFSDGGKYRGERKHNQQAGAGTAVYPNGIKYMGAFADGRFHDFGVMEMPGTTYEGHFKHGFRCGTGKLTFTQSATFYDGEFYDNKRHGKGTETNALGQTRVSRQDRGVQRDVAPCVLGEAIRLIKRKRANATESEETWYRRLLRVRDDLRALDLQYAHWDAEAARMSREDDERIEALKKARREKREAQAAVKKAFFSNEAAERDDDDDEEEDDDEEDEGEQEDEKEGGESAAPGSAT